MWEKLKMELKERFLTFEAAKGVFLIPAGAVIIYIAWMYQQYTFQVSCTLMGVYMISEGLRKITVNRIKQALNIEKMKAARLALIKAEEKRKKAEAQNASISLL